MRAVALSDEQNIAFLNENFINTWVSNVELRRTPRKHAFMARRFHDKSKTFDRSYPLAQAIMKGWNEHSPVDCLVLSPELELMASMPVNDFFDAELEGLGDEEAYLFFLEASLAGKKPGLDGSTLEPQPTTDWNVFFNSGTVVNSLKIALTHERPEQEVLNIFRTPESGYQDYTAIEIDTTAFEDGGMLIIDISVGGAEPAGSFDLYSGDSELPTEGVPQGVLGSAWGVPPCKTGIIKYPFERGGFFKLGVTGDWFSEKGSINAFLAKVSVKPETK